MILTLAELCTRNVVDNFRTNDTVISIYDLGDHACTDIITRLWHAEKVDDSNIDRLQVERIEALKCTRNYSAVFSAKMSRWLADIVAAGLEELDIDCHNFDMTVARTIVRKYLESRATSSVSSEQEESPAPAIAALRTLCIHNYYSDEHTYFDNLALLLPIFSSTLKNLKMSVFLCYSPSSPQQSQLLLNTIGTLHLDKLYLYTNTRNISFAVSPSMQNLKTLRLYMDGWTDQHVLSFLEVAGQSIQHLGVQSKLITDLTLQNIQLYCPNLVSLKLLDNYSLTSAGLEQFFTTASLTKLERLSMYKIDVVTDAVVAKLAAVGQLTYVNLQGCNASTKQTRQSLASIKTLKYVCWLDHEEDDVDEADNKIEWDFLALHGLDHCHTYDDLHADDW